MLTLEQGCQCQHVVTLLAVGSAKQKWTKVAIGGAEGAWIDQVDYQERFSATGRIPHNAQRRELAPSSREVGIAQSVQAALEPLFAKGFAARCQARRASQCLYRSSVLCASPNRSA